MKWEIPKPVAGEIPTLGTFKTKMLFPRIFSYGSDDHARALDM
jgi:hypothetical protein